MCQQALKTMSQFSRNIYFSLHADKYLFSKPNFIKIISHQNTVVAPAESLFKNGTEKPLSSLRAAATIDSQIKS